MQKTAKRTMCQNHIRIIYIQILFLCLLLSFPKSLFPQTVLNRNNNYIIFKGEKPLNRKGLVWRTLKGNRVCIGEIITLKAQNGFTAAKILYEDLEVKKGDSISLLSKKDSESRFSKYLINILRTGTDSPDLGGVYVKDIEIKYIFTNDNMIVLKDGSIYKVSDKFTENILEWRMGDRIILIDGKEMINSNREFIAVKIKLIE